MCARLQDDVLRVLHVPVFQFFTYLWRHVLGVRGVLCVLLGLCMLYVGRRTALIGDACMAH